MIKNKEHFKEGDRLIARQGAMKSGCIRRLMYIVGVFKDKIKRFSLTFKSLFKSCRNAVGPEELLFRAVNTKTGSLSFET